MKIRRIAIDEIAIMKGHKYFTIIRDYDTGLVIKIIFGRAYEETAKALVLSAILNVALNLLLLPLWGIIGSAIASAFSLIIWNAVLWWTVWKELGINSLAFNVPVRRLE